MESTILIEQMDILTELSSFEITEFQISCIVTIDNITVFKKIKLIDEDFDKSELSKIQRYMLFEILGKIMVGKDPKIQIISNYILWKRRENRINKLVQ